MAYASARHWRPNWSAIRPAQSSGLDTANHHGGVAIPQHQDDAVLPILGVLRYSDESLGASVRRAYRGDHRRMDSDAARPSLADVVAWARAYWAVLTCLC